MRHSRLRPCTGSMPKTRMAADVPFRAWVPRSFSPCGRVTKASTDWRVRRIASPVILVSCSRHIAAAIDLATGTGAELVVRSAAPLAAELAGASSTGLLPSPLISAALPTLLVCGSHTAGATTQLRPVIDQWGPPALINTDLALDSQGQPAREPPSWR